MLITISNVLDCWDNFLEDIRVPSIPILFIEKSTGSSNSLYTPTNYRMLRNYDEENIRSILHVIFVQGFFLYLLYAITQ